VENTLKNFELNSGGNKQEFFKNITGVIHPANPMAAVTGSSSLGSDEKNKAKLLGSQSMSNSPANSFGMNNPPNHNSGPLNFNDKSEPNSQKATGPM